MPQIYDPSTSTAQSVDATSKAARGILYDRFGRVLARRQTDARDDTNDEGVIMAGVNDGHLRHARMDRTGGLASANNRSLFSDQFEGTTLSAARWLTISTTMAAAQLAATGVTFNSGSITTAATGYMLKTLRTFARPMRSILQAKFRIRPAHVVNAVMEAGFGDATTATGAHTNGAYLQITAAGVMQLVWTFNGVDQSSVPIGAFDPTKYYTVDVLMDDDWIRCVVQDTATGLFVGEKSINLPLTASKHFASTRLSGFARLFQPTAPATAPLLILPFFEVVQLDSEVAKSFKQLQAGQGLGADFHPSTGAQNAQFTNSAAPASATLSNTVPGYTTLGGLFQFAAVAGGNTDYVLFAFAVPAPFQFHCDGIDIETWNLGAAVATSDTTLMWAAGIDQQGSSLATAGVVRKLIGAQRFPTGSAIGFKAERLSVDFDTPAVTNPGRFMTVILRMPVGTATASEIFQGLVNIRGYFE